MVNRRLGVYVLLLIVAIAAFLRLYNLSAEAVDGDELFSRRVASLQISEMLVAVRADLVHPPLYYLLLKGATSLWGSSVLGIRLPSLVLGLLAIPLCTLLGSKLPGAKYAGAVAAALLALNSEMIFYSQQTRSYMLYVVLVQLLWGWASTLNGENCRSDFLPWLAGALIMAALVYTHYIGALYIGSVLIAVVLSNVCWRRKLLMLSASGVAAIVFTPWLVSIWDIYQQRNGVGSNLNWQGQPSIYDVKALWASAIGVVGVRGGTTIALSIVLLLVICAVAVRPEHRIIRDSPLVLSLIACSFLPPVLIYLLSVPPFGLPLFGCRHLLPSVVAIGLLCSWGTEQISARFSARQMTAFCTLSIVILSLSALSTVNFMRQIPHRYPYNGIAQQSRRLSDKGYMVYTTWEYGIAEPVNFYCQQKCVHALPEHSLQLPNSFYLLYRPSATAEKVKLDWLVQQGFDAEPQTFFTNGRKSPYGTRLTLLRRRIEFGATDTSNDPGVRLLQ